MATKAVVDATLLQQAIPPHHDRGFTVEGGDGCVPDPTLFIDCTARDRSRGMESAGPVLGYRYSGPDLRSHAPALIRLQCVRFPMLSLSAALIAAIEARVGDAQVPADGGTEAADLQRLKDLGPAVQENLLKLHALIGKPVDQ